MGSKASRFFWGCVEILISPLFLISMEIENYKMDKMKPISKKVVQKVYFCPKCNERMIIEDYQGGTAGNHTYLRCLNTECKHHTEWLDHP